jgi:ankyrin repeat protein
MSIIHDGDTRAHIHTPTADYFEVISLSNCRWITLENLNIGHDVDYVSCTAAVIGIDDCKDVEITNCRLYGCGSRGIEAFRVGSLIMTDSEITDCSSGIMIFYNSSDLQFERCSFNKNDIYFSRGYGGGVVCDKVMGIEFIDCVFEDNTMPEGANLFRLEDSSYGTLANTNVDGLLKTETITGYPVLLRNKAIEYLKGVDYKDYDRELGKNVQLGYANIVEVLLERDANPNYVYPDTKCPVIQAAIYNDSYEITKLLLDAGASCHKEDPWGREAVFYTAKCRNMNLVRMVEEKMGMIYSDDAGRSPGMYAAMYSNWEVMMYMLENYSMVNIGDRRGRDPGLYAVANNQQYIVGNIFSKGMSQRMGKEDNQGRGMLHYAVAVGDSSMVAFLAGKGSINKQDKVGLTPLHFAIAGQSAFYELGIDHMRRHLENPGRMYNPDYKPVEFPQVTPADYLVVMKTLLDNGADVDLRSPDGMSPLIATVLQGNSEAIKLLLEYRPNPYVRYNGKTALDIAIEMELDSQLIQMLRDAM